VVILGLVSFFNDLASDVVIPLIPILLAGVLAAGPLALGLVEGVADAVASFLKLWAGRHSDVVSGRRKALAMAGYTLSNIARPLLGLAGTWTAVLVLRSVDRVGKGIRSAPRDALVADATPAPMRGYAFGFHRALDNAGAVGGSLLAAAVLAWSGLDLRSVILLSAVPGMLAVLLMALGVREPRAQRPPAARERLSPLRWSALGADMRRYLLILTGFTFARASETFILLRGYELGMGTVSLLLLWAALNCAKAATGTLGGILADRHGRRALLLTGWIAFAVAFAALAVFPHPPALWAIAIGYGFFSGASEGAERAVIADSAAPEERGTAFGWYHLAVGLAAIPGGAAFGALWQWFGAGAAFAFAACAAALPAAALRLWAWGGLAPPGAAQPAA
jgi:MFS family permease